MPDCFSPRIRALKAYAGTAQAMRAANLADNLAHAFVLGIGFTSTTQGQGAEDFVRARMARLGVVGLSCIATLASGKIMPPFLQNLAKAIGDIPVLCYPAWQLERETARLLHPSRAVYRAVGCHGVAEAAALCALGRQARLVLEKTVFNGMTFALACGSAP